MAAPKLQLLSRTIYDTDGTTTEWDFNFSGGYLLPSHVKAYYENEFGFRTDVTVTEAMLIGEYQLRIAPALPAGSVLVIYRSTPKDAPMVNFMERGTVSEISLDTTAKQAVFVAAEAADEVNTVDWNKIMEAATEADASEQAAAASAAASAASATLADTLTQNAKAAVIASGTATAAAASASASAAAASRNEAVAAQNKAVAAWAASTAPNEQLAAIDQTLHAGTIVKALVYDTSMDADGGAWRDRCKHTSWYNDVAISGSWLGQASNEAAARNKGDAVGPELLLNPNFASDLSTWTGVNWVWYQDSTRAGQGVAVSQGTNPLSSNVSAVAGATYEVTIEVTRCGPSGLLLDWGNSIQEDLIQQPGTHTFRYTSASTQTTSVVLWPQADGANQTAVSYVSVKRVGGQGGDYYQSSDNGKFYWLTGNSGQTEVFRGNKRDFPAVAGIVAEAYRVVIYDLTAPGCPMWMVVAPVQLNGIGDGFWRSSRVATSVHASGGTVYFGVTLPGSEDAAAGLCFLNFARGLAGRYPSATVVNGGEVQMGSLLTANLDDSLPRLVSAQVNDIAVTVLPDAPVDAATGLPIPTIYVATMGGVSMIRHDGTVVNGLTGTKTYGVDLSQGLLRVMIEDGSKSGGKGNPVVQNLNPDTLVSLSLESASTFGFNGWEFLSSLACGHVGFMNSGLSFGRVVLGKHNPSAVTKGMRAFVTNTYNSGWQVGDSRGAWLADVVAETVTTSELLVNGDFSAGATGWSAQAGALLDASTGELKVTASGLTYGGAQRSFPAVAGKSYVVTFEARRGTASACWLVCASGTNVSHFAVTESVMTKVTKTFVADGSFIALTCQVNNSLDGGTAFFDNISVKLAEADRSVKNAALSIVGTLTKAPVAAGAQLVEYSGFSAANGLEQPYSPNLDFGAGDFGLMMWVNHATVGNTQVFVSRGSAADAPLFGLWMDAGVYKVACAATDVSVSTGYTATAGRSMLTMLRKDGVLEAWVNDRKVYSGANTANITNNLAKLSIGRSYSGGSWASGTSLALVRITATAPTADQIAKIYRDELQLFQPNAQCAIAGTSSGVTALDYDDTTDLLHVGTQWGRTSFHDLVRVDSEATTVGAVTTITAQGGAVVMGGTGGRIYQPAKIGRAHV